MTEAEKTKIQKPDFDAYNEKLENIFKSIEEIKKKLNNLQNEIKVASKAREEYNKKKKDMVVKIDSYQNEIDRLEKERRTLLEDVEKKQKHKKELKVNAQNMKKQLGFEKEEDIEKKISEIENKLMTSTISIKEEKLLINQIQVLNKNKSLLSSFSKQEDEASKYDNASIAPLKSKIDSIREEINEFRNKKKIERNKLKELQNNYQEKNNKLNELNVLRDNYYKKINHFFAEKRSVEIEQEEKRQQFREYELSLLQAKQQKLKEERERKNLELEKEKLEKQLEDIDVVPFREELALIENVLAYLKRLKEDAKVDEPKKQPSNLTKKINGHVEQISNNDTNDADITGNDNNIKEDEEDINKVKTDTDSNNNNNINNKKSKNKKDKYKAFKLDMNILCYFVTVGINPPVSFDEIDACVVKLNEKKSIFEKKRQDSIQDVESRRSSCMEKLKEIDEKLTKLRPEQSKNSKAHKVKA
ncbi:conserved protein, unknown function [Hepatocystis sp. ex Piliocolobus tephrosceles]|nr:conserved protein, unknown function [Hepatocystis sp. ex Piliocolobus tephrosceles]